MQSPARICIFNDQQLIRDALVSILSTEPGTKVVASCGSLEEAIKILASEVIDVVLLDVQLGPETAIRLLSELQRRGVITRVLVIAAEIRDDEALRLAISGVAGVVLKSASRETLLQAVRRVIDGDLVFEQYFLRTLLRKAAQLARSEHAEFFTLRERSVLRCVFDGLSNKQIAAHLGLRESSVKGAIQRLFEKTRVRTRGQLVRVALERFQDEVTPDAHGDSNTYAKAAKSAA